MSDRRLILPPEPSAAADGERHQFGLSALRKRYVRRAAHLVDDEAFRQAISDARRAWNDEHPSYALHIGDQITDTGMPKSLEDACELNIRAFSAATASAERGAAFWPPEMDAQAQWHRMVADLAIRFWPPETFPAPGMAIHPATGFVTACLTAELWRIDPADHFDMPTLRVVRTSDRVSIPLHPGVTAEDIRRAADRLAQEANCAHSLNLIERDVRKLRAAGFTLQAIADQLGIPEPSVRAILSD